MNELRATHLFAQSIGSIEFDSLLSEQHESTLAITEYPVESGAPIADHAYRENDRLTLTIGHSLTRLEGVSEPDDIFRLVELYDALKTAQRNAELLEVGTGIFQYENLLIQNIATVRDANNVTIMQVVVALREIRVVNVNQIDRFVERYAEAGGIRARASTNVPRGSVAVEDIQNTQEQIDLDTSVAQDLFNRFTN